MAQVQHQRAEKICRARARESGGACDAQPDRRRHRQRAAQRQRQFAGRHARRAAPDAHHPGQPPAQKCRGVCQPDCGHRAGRRAGAAVRCGDGGRQRGIGQDRKLGQRRTRHHAFGAAPAGRQHRRHGGCDQGGNARAHRADAVVGPAQAAQRPLGVDPQCDPRRAGHAGDHRRPGRAGDFPVPAQGHRHLHSGAVAADFAARHGGADVRLRLQPGQYFAARHHPCGRAGGG